MHQMHERNKSRNVPFSVSPANVLSLVQRKLRAMFFRFETPLFDGTRVVLHFIRSNRCQSLMRICARLEHRLACFPAVKCRMLEARPESRCSDQRSGGAMRRRMRLMDGAVIPERGMRLPHLQSGLHLAEILRRYGILHPL